MAESSKNLGTEGLSGSVANFVFRHRKIDGKTFVQHLPGKRTSEPTELQLVNQHKFQRAVIYGNAVMGDPVRKAAYKEKAKRGKTAYNVAVADYLNAPHIDKVDVSAYTGLPGSKIFISAFDDFAVVKVDVHIVSNTGVFIEQGSAVPVADDPLNWIYTTTATNALVSGEKITVTAYDNPGNKGIDNVIIS